MKRVWLMLAMALVVAGPVWAEREMSPGQKAWLTDPAVMPPKDRVMHTVKPSETDPQIKNFDEEHVVMFNRSSAAHAPLAIFMTGTSGRPVGARLILSVMANQGYRAIGLEYNDVPAVIQVCPQSPDPDCSANFRHKRIFGGDVTALVDNPLNEAVIPRLVSLLQYLDAKYPDEHWGSYLVNGEPEWSNIVVSGQSQGAGMAAYIAKKRLVQRVVLFSSPWDFYGRSRTLAPWIGAPSVTPMDRWYAEYHARENTADLLPKSYKLLGIPDANVRVFNGEPPPEVKSPNPYHATTATLPVYVPDWQAMYGKAP